MVVSIYKFSSQKQKEEERERNGAGKKFPWNLQLFAEEEDSDEGEVKENPSEGEVSEGEEEEKKYSESELEDAYINMDMRSISNTVAAEIQMARAEDYGIDLVEVDSHSGARPKCARDQGKIFDQKNKSDKYPHWSSSSYGQPDGLLGINCRHHIWPYIEGVSIHRYFPTEDLEENDRLYKATQVQRALEREVRKQKRECMLYDQIGDKDGFEFASVRLKEKEAKLRKYVNGNPNLHRRKDREQVVGFDRRVSAEAVGANQRTKKPSYLRNNMPKGYEDKRKVGKPISHEDLDNFIQTATQKGIRIGTTSNPTGGFEHYRGNPKVLHEVLDNLEASMKYAKINGLYDKDVILYYDNVLGYEGDNSMIDVGAFALTRGKTITLNKFMFDDSDYLKEEYKEAVKARMFTQGSDYTNIVNHEFWHILDKKNKKLREKVVNVLKKDAEKANMNLDNFIKKHISGYATAKTDAGDLSFHELLAELGAMYHGDKPEYAKEIYRKVGILNEI